MITKAKLERWTTLIMAFAAVCLLIWAGYVSFAEHKVESGKIEKTYQENGVTKLEFVSDSGQTQILEVPQKIGEVPVGKKIKLRIVRLPLLQPRITEIQEEQ